MAPPALPSKRNAEGRNGRLIGRLAKKATSKASERAFDENDTQVIERKGWLVRINRAGKVVEKIERIKKKHSFEKLKLLK